MCKKSAYSVSLALLLCLACRVMAMEEFIDPVNITATAWSANYQLESIYSCDGSGLTGEQQINHINTVNGPPNVSAAILFKKSLDFIRHDQYTVT